VFLLKRILIRIKIVKSLNMDFFFTIISIPRPLTTTRQAPLLGPPPLEAFLQIEMRDTKMVKLNILAAQIYYYLLQRPAAIS
jgi:hypothetical protein